MANTLLNEYYAKLDSPELDVNSVLNEFRKINDELKESIDDDSEEMKILTLENELLNLNKSIENELVPTMSGTSKDENGNEVITMWPDHRRYDEEILSYFLNRYETVTNLYLKSEYGLLLYLKKVLKKNDEKKELVDVITDLIEIYWNKVKTSPEEWKNYRRHIYKRYLDAILILIRGGKPLEANLKEFVKGIQSTFLKTDVRNEIHPSFADFIVSCFTNHKRKTQDYLNIEKVWSHIEGGGAFQISTNSDSVIRTSKGAVAFGNSFGLTSETNYQSIIGRKYEEEANEEVQKENWIGAIKSFENSLKYYWADKDSESVERIQACIDQHKGKFEMGLIQSEGTEEESEMLESMIKGIVDSKDLNKILISIAGYNILPRYSSLYPRAIEDAKRPSFLNSISTQSMDKYGNSIRIYQSEEENIEYHLIHSTDIMGQVAFQVTSEILRRSIRNNAISFEDIEKHFKDSWLNDEIRLLGNGKLTKVIPLKAILPGIQLFFKEINNAMKIKDYEPNFVCCIDSMALKIEYALRNMCFKLGISTFTFEHKNNVMIYEEASLRKLLSSLENELDQNDIWLIRFLLNEKGARNIRNRVAHGLLDSDEYGYSKALMVFTLLLRLSFYKFSEKTKS